MRNTVSSGTEVWRDLEPAITAALPRAWSVYATRERPGTDGLLTLAAPDGTTTTVVVETKKAVEPRDVASAVLQARSKQANPGAVLIAAPYLSPRTREVLAESGTGWFDLTGNLRLQLDRPALFIDRVGASRSPYTDPDDRRLRSLRGAGAARIVRALLDGKPPFGVRSLADTAEVGIATSARVLDLLARESLVDRADRGQVTSVSKRSLVRRWTADYRLTATNDAIPMLAPRGLGGVLRELTSCDGEYAVTAEAGARAYLPADTAAVAPLSLLAVFAADPLRAQDALGLRQVERGANVLLIAPFDDVVFRGAVERDGVRYAAASQVVTDLLTSPGRAAEQAEPLFDVLAAGDSGWAR
jgi:hypothetical protein